MRNGKDIKEKLCDEYKYIIDENESYDNLSALVKENISKFKAEDVLYWVVVGADWIGKNEENEKKVIDALNKTLDLYRGPNGKLLRVDKLGKETYGVVLDHMKGYNPKKMDNILMRFLDDIS